MKRTIGLAENLSNQVFLCQAWDDLRMIQAIRQADPASLTEDTELLEESAHTTLDGAWYFPGVGEG